MQSITNCTDRYIHVQIIYNFVPSLSDAIGKINLRFILHAISLLSAKII